MKQSLNEIADKVIEQLQCKVIIHRYDSHTTNSIYLKFDYGVANSLRISDHDGKEHLRYRYNILEDMRLHSSKIERTRKGLPMVFYGPHMINSCCRDILNSKREKMARYLNYTSAVEDAKKNASGPQPQKSFWVGARLVSDEEET